MLLVQQSLGHKLSNALLVENNSTGTSSFFYQLIHALNFVLSSLKIGSGFRALAALSRILSKGIIQLAWVGTSERVTVLYFYSLNLDAEAGSTTVFALFPMSLEGPSSAPPPFQTEGLESTEGNALCWRCLCEALRRCVGWGSTC